MNWQLTAQFVEVTLSLLLIGRLLWLDLHKIYAIFCAFLLANISGTLVWLVELYLYDPSPKARWHIDYRVSWLLGRVAIWIFTIWTLYVLLGAILTMFKGLRRLARKVLRVSFGLAVLVSLISTVGEYHALVAAGGGPAADPINKLVEITFIFDRAICSVALLILVVTLAFVLWFPVEISRNLIVFSAGFAVYFAAKTSLLLEQSYWSHEITRAISIAVTLVMSACLAYWAIFISKPGEEVVVRPGHAWQPAQQERLMLQLESLNASLLRAARR